ncbi:MAG: hypothetical protein ACK478_13405 [Flavobacteriales bacterium]|jgi:hypothetical protein
MRGLFISIMLLAVGPMLAQWDGLSFKASQREPDTVWIITGKHVLGPAYRKFKLDFSLDARQTLIGSQAARVGGVRIGLEYRRVHRFGVGLYGVGDGVSLSSLAEIDSSITWAKLTLSYQSLYYERVMYFSRKLEWSLTAHYGRGRITGSYVRLGEANLQALPEQRVGVLEFSTLGYYNLNYWCSVGLGVGYRYMLSTPADIRSVYEAPVGLLRVRFKLGKLVKSIWDKDTKNLY